MPMIYKINPDYLESQKVWFDQSKRILINGPRRKANYLKTTRLIVSSSKVTDYLLKYLTDWRHLMTTKNYPAAL